MRSAPLLVALGMAVLALPVHAAAPVPEWVAAQERLEATTLQGYITDRAGRITCQFEASVTASRLHVGGLVVEDRFRIQNGSSYAEFVWSRWNHRPTGELRWDGPCLRVTAEVGWGELSTFECTDGVGRMQGHLSTTPTNPFRFAVVASGSCERTL